MTEGRIMAIDYGKKRVGLAVTDPLRLIATRLATVNSGEIWKYLDQYFSNEEVPVVVIGYPVTLNNQPSEAVKYIDPFVKAFRRKYPGKMVELADERFTSRLAFQALIDGGVKKSGRKDKSLVDGVSATILLQSYLEQIKYKQ